MGLSINLSNWKNQEYIELLDGSFYKQEDKRLLTLEKSEKFLLMKCPTLLYFLKKRK